MRVAVRAASIVVYAANVAVLVILFLLGLIGNVYLILLSIAMVLVAVLRVILPRSYEKVTSPVDLLGDVGRVIGIDFIGIYLHKHSQAAICVAATALILSFVLSMLGSRKTGGTRTTDT